MKEKTQLNEMLDAAIAWTERNEPSTERNVLFLSDRLYLAAKRINGQQVEAINGWRVIWVQMPPGLVMAGAEVDIREKA